MKRKLIIGMIIYLIILIYSGLRLYGELPADETDLGSVLLSFNCNIQLKEPVDVLSLLLTLFPSFIPVFLFHNTVSNDFEQNYAYILSRTDRRMRWYCSDCIRCLRHVLLLNLMFLLISTLFFYGIGYRRLETAFFLKAVLRIASLNFLTQAGAILLANAVFLEIREIPGSVVGCGAIVITNLLLMLYYIKNKTFLLWLPFTQNLVSLQEWQKINRGIPGLRYYKEGFHYSQGFMTAAAWCILFFLLGAAISKKKEFY